MTLKNPQGRLGSQQVLIWKFLNVPKVTITFGLKFGVRLGRLILPVIAILLLVLQALAQIKEASEGGVAGAFKSTRVLISGSTSSI